MVDETLGNKTTSDMLMALCFAFNRTAAFRVFVPEMLPGQIEIESYQALVRLL